MLTVSGDIFHVYILFSFSIIYILYAQQLEHSASGGLLLLEGDLTPEIEFPALVRYSASISFMHARDYVQGSLSRCFIITLLLQAM
jgi:hypothetical protein